MSAHTPASDSSPSHRFSLVVGGPFHALLRRMGGIDANGLPTRAIALRLAFLAWLLPALAVVAQSLLDDAYEGGSYFTDATVVARYLVGVFVLIATERRADGRIGALLGQFRAAGIVRPEDEPRFQSLLAQADHRTSSKRAEGLIAALALAFGAFGIRIAADLSTGSWETSPESGLFLLSWAGVIASSVSGPLFFFLLVRWGWRFLVWTLFLRQMSQLRLALVPLHPDRSGGLGFLAVFPSIFTGFVFSLSCVVAVTVLKELRYVDLSNEQIQLMCGGWMAFVLVLFVGPLLVFVPVLRELRDDALLEIGRFAHRYHQAFAARWLERGAPSSASDLLGSQDASTSADLNALVASLDEMRVVPIDRAAIVELVAAAGAPLVGVAATRIPVGELLKRIAMGFL